MVFQRLKDLKEDKELKQYSIAKIINVSENTYGRYERGEKDITLEKALILAEYYNVSLDYIAGRTNDKKGMTHSELPQDETKIIKNFRSLSESGKSKVLGYIERILEEENEKQAKRNKAI